jgi:hypothetical protein
LKKYPLIERRANRRKLMGKGLPDHPRSGTILFLRALTTVFFATGGVFLNPGGRRQDNKAGSYDNSNYAKTYPIFFLHIAGFWI